MLVVLYYQYLILDNLEMFFMFVVNVMFVDINSILCRSLTVSMISSLETMVELLQQSQCIVVLTKFGKAPRVAVKKIVLLLIYTNRPLLHCACLHNCY